MGKKNTVEFPGKHTHNKTAWWTARDDSGEIRTFRWEHNQLQWPLVRKEGLTGFAYEWPAKWPAKQVRLHLCASQNCPAKLYDGSKRGKHGPCDHVRFIGMVPEEEASKLFDQLCDMDEEAEEMDAVPAGGTSSGDAVVVPSSAMGGGPACVYPTVATDMHPAVAVVPAGEQQVGASQVEEAVTLPAEPGYTNAVHGGGILLFPPRRMQPFLKELLMWENCQRGTATERIRKLVRKRLEANISSHPRKDGKCMQPLCKDQQAPR